MGARKNLRRSGIGLALGMALCWRLGLGQTAPAQDRAPDRASDKPGLFQAYFEALVAEPHGVQRGDPHAAERETLLETIPTMSPAELRQAVSIIDAAIDRARTTQDGVVRLRAGMLLLHIAGTAEGPALMEPEITHLRALCSDPFLLAGSFRMFLTANMQRQYADLKVSSMREAIQAPEANAASGKGPAYATILFLYPRDGDLMKDVLVYMQRSDLTGTTLLDFLSGIRASSVMPDAVVERLMVYLKDPLPEVRMAALHDIRLGSPAERERVMPVLQQLADDPAQTEALHTLAVETLAGDKASSPSSAP